MSQISDREMEVHMGGARFAGGTLSRRMCLRGAVGLIGGGSLMASGGAGSTPPSPPLPRGGKDEGATGGKDGEATAGEKEVARAGEGEGLTLAQSLRLGGQNLLAILNPENNYLPYWALSVEPDYRAQLDIWWPAHNIGRWWDAMMRIEEAIGFEIPKPIEAAMVENVHRFFDNPDHISLSPDRVNEWDLHSLREGLLALNAMARWRKDEWAAGMGRQMIQSVGAKLRDDGTWDVEKFDACQKRGKQVIHSFDPCDTHGRMLEAIIWFHETTGDVEALRLADRIARWHFANTTQPDGAINPACRADHTHSYLGTLRGLLLWGRLTRQREYVDRVAATYRVTVPRVVKESGYTSHNMVAESFGETTSPGDAAQLALWLCQEGYSEFIDDAERIVRARILPSQIRQSPPLRPAAEDGKDAHRDLDRRIIGAYGGCHGHPHGGKKAVTDVTSADVHTLVDIYKHVAVASEGRIEVLFHLDYEDSRVRVVCRREKRAELTVTPKAEAGVAIRVPRWTPRESVRVRVGEDVVKPVFAGPFAWVGKVPAGGQITMEYDLPEHSNKEKDLGVEYEVFWRGDDVVGVRPNADFYPFYPDAPAKQQ